MVLSFLLLRPQLSLPRARSSAPGHDRSNGKLNFGGTAALAAGEPKFCLRSRRALQACRCRAQGWALRRLRWKAATPERRAVSDAPARTPCARARCRELELRPGACRMVVRVGRVACGQGDGGQGCGV